MKRLPPETFRLWREALQGVEREGAMQRVESRLLCEALDALMTELEQAYRELDAIIAIVDRCQNGTALAWLQGFGDVRDAIYPDTEVARLTREARRVTPSVISAPKDGVKP